jgi:hypothetical protein
MKFSIMGSLPAELPIVAGDKPICQHNLTVHTAGALAQTIYVSESSVASPFKAT